MTKIKDPTDRLLLSKKPEAVLGQYAKRMAELQEQFDKLKPLKKEYGALRAALVAFAEDQYENDDDLDIETPNVKLEISANDWERTVTDMEGLFKHLGKAKFFKLCAISMSMLDTMMTPAQQKKFVKRTRTGPRTVKLTVLKKGGRK